MDELNDSFLLTKNIDELLQYKPDLLSQEISPEEYQAQLLELTTEINALTDEIAQYTTKNSDIRIDCNHLEHKLSILTNAIQQNVTYLQENNARIQQENVSLSDEIDEESKQIENIKQCLLKLVESGVSLSELVDIELDELMELCGLTADDLIPEPLDPIALAIINTNPYFSEVESNEEFCKKCLILQKEYEKYQKRAHSSSIINTQSATTVELKKQLAREREQYTKDMSKRAVMTKSFMDQISQFEESESQSSSSQSIQYIKTPDPSKRKRNFDNSPPRTSLFFASEGKTAPQVRKYSKHRATKENDSVCRIISFDTNI